MLDGALSRFSFRENVYMLDVDGANGAVVVGKGKSKSILLSQTASIGHKFGGLTY
jgi:hypothetical protein